MKHSESIIEISKAFVKAQGEMNNVKRNTENAFLKSSYSDLAIVLETIRPVFSKNGLALMQFPEFGEKGITIITRLVHESGEWFETDLSANAVDNRNSAVNEAQKMGSVITYLRRYVAMAISGTASEDDDDAQSLTPVDGKTKGKTKGEEKPITVQDRLDKLPQDLRDLITKAGANTLQQRLRIMNQVGWNIEAAKKLCLEQVKK